jgi:N-acyl-D-aspartate/D-glutamate deacylase
MHDTIIRNATLIDGSGSPRFRGDLAIRDDA